MDRAFDIITDTCLSYYDFPEKNKPIDAAFSVMKDPSFPMHNFAHHYLVPAILLAETALRTKAGRAKLEDWLAKARSRAQNVLPGFCGLYGACGAAVGCGIFFSVYTETTPLSKATWGPCNACVAAALSKMAELGGPRCCKRNTFTALIYMREFIKGYFSIETDLPQSVECAFSDYNAECLKEDCPYYKTS